MGQIVIDRADCHGALPNRPGHALNRAVPHIAYGEDTGQDCLKLQWRSCQRPHFEGHVPNYLRWPIQFESKGTAQTNDVIVAIDHWSLWERV
jgi:hypothetical protein